MQIYKVASGEKCGFCQVHADKIYLAADSEKQANALHSEYVRGICASCLIELFLQEGYQILQPSEKAWAVSALGEPGGVSSTS